MMAEFPFLVNYALKHPIILKSLCCSLTAQAGLCESDVVHVTQAVNYYETETFQKQNYTNEMLCSFSVCGIRLVVFLVGVF